MQATVLVDEAFMRLAGTDKIDWQNRAHFCDCVSREMRRVLVDYASGQLGPISAREHTGR